MLKVTIEVVPGGDTSRARTIAILRLALTGAVGAGNIGDYMVEVLQPDPACQVREDGRIEKLCPHGIGHAIGSFHGRVNVVHGCDGCCRDYPSGLTQIPLVSTDQFDVRAHRRDTGALELVRRAFEALMLKETR